MRLQLGFLFVVSLCLVPSAFAGSTAGLSCKDALPRASELERLLGTSPTAAQIATAWNDMYHGNEPTIFNEAELNTYARKYGFKIAIDTRWTGYEDTLPVPIVTRDYSNPKVMPPKSFRLIPGDLGEGHFESVSPTWSKDLNRWVYPTDVEIPR